MLYPTHKRYGQVFGLASIPLAVHMGMIPSVNLQDDVGKVIGDFIVVMMYVMVAYRGALFGAEFPDIDSPGSIPARKHFIIQKWFRLFGVKHRGKFSHDFVSLGLLFLGIYFGLEYGMGALMQWLLDRGLGNSELTPLVALLTSEGLLLELMKVYVLFILVGAYSHLIADASTKEGVWFLWKIRIHIVPVFITRWRIGGWQPFKNAFRTGSSWEDFNWKLMTGLLPLVLLWSIYNVINF